MPSDPTDSFSADVGDLRNIGRDGRPDSGPYPGAACGAKNRWEEYCLTLKLTGTMYLQHQCR
jgi:hypothetical protein